MAMSIFETNISYTYHQDDMQQILNLAIARQSDKGEFSRGQLLEIAAELGISPQALQEAEQEWLLQQQQRQKHSQFNFYRRSQLKKHFGRFVIINSFFMGLNVLTAGQLSWALYILLFWGAGLGLNAWNTYQLQGQEYERAFQKWHRRQQLSQMASSLYSRVNNWLKALG